MTMRGLTIDEIGHIHRIGMESRGSKGSPGSFRTSLPGTEHNTPEKP